MTTMKILASVVTYNRCHLLSRCLDYVMAQTRPPDDILVINNSSTDSTTDMLSRRNISFITQPNSGSAGGWKSAIHHLLTHRYDAIWLMDDDGFPSIYALEQLEKSCSSGVACVSSVVVKENDPNTFVFPYPTLSSTHEPKLFSFPRKIGTLTSLRQSTRSDQYPYVHLFNGALISRQSIEQIGNVRDDFYIAGDELDYLYRLRSAGQVFSLLSALHYHPDVSARPYSSAKIYYYTRNSIIINRLYLSSPFVRNLLVIIVILFRVLARNGTRAFFSYLIGPKARSLHLAIKSGNAGITGQQEYD